MFLSQIKRIHSKFFEKMLNYCNNSGAKPGNWKPRHQNRIKDNNNKKKLNISLSFEK